MPVRFRRLLIAALLLLPALSLRAAEPATSSAITASDCVRLRRDFRRQPLALDTAVVRLAGESAGQAFTVDLVGAIHIADASYYQALNRRFENYEVVLYELVADPGDAPIDLSQRGGNPLSAVQGGLQALLDLVHQLDAVDYRRSNFTHADLTPIQFSESMTAGGESVTDWILRAIDLAGTGRIGVRGMPTDTALLAAFVAVDRPLQLKRVLAPIFVHMDELVTAFEGDAGTTLLARRNDRALTVLDQVLAKGQRRVAIFYGAAHLPDLERRLRSENGMNRIGVDWLVAWDLSGNPPD